MIEKKDDSALINSNIIEPITLNDDSVAGSVSAADITVVVLTESRQLLQQNTAKVQENISECFARLLDALKYREKQLLRQVDVHHSQQLALLQSSQTPHTDIKTSPGAGIPDVSVNLGAENDLVENILSFGKLNLGAGNLMGTEGNSSPYSVPYKLEDYQDATNDHMCLYKLLTPTDELATHQVIRFGFAPKLNLTDQSYSQEAEGEQITAEPKNVEEEEDDEAVTGVVQERRPSQVQQWLQQIMAETETEPTVGEVAKNFDDMSPSKSSDD